jgi:hypothetical protein
MSQDVAGVVNAFKEDKALAEACVQDIKRSYTPDSPEYQRAEALYFKARSLNDAYVGQIALAASTGDRSVVPDQYGRAARSAETEFVTAATETLSPADRGLPIAAALGVLPAISHIVASIRAEKRRQAIDTFASQVRWRSWDSITPVEEPSPTAKATKRSRSRATGL